MEMCLKFLATAILAEGVPQMKIYLNEFLVITYNIRCLSPIINIAGVSIVFMMMMMMMLMMRFSHLTLPPSQSTLKHGSRLPQLILAYTSPVSTSTSAWFSPAATCLAAALKLA
jgi:hypothetical protein